MKLESEEWIQESHKQEFPHNTSWACFKCKLKWCHPPTVEEVAADEAVLM